jgi:hypothetical protein
MTKTLRTLALTVTALLAACGAEAPKDGQLAVTVSPAIGDADVSRVSVEIDPAGVSQDLHFSSGNGQFQALLAVPVGTQTVTATAYGDPDGDGFEDVLGIGTVTVDVLEGESASVFIRILDVTPPPPAPDHSPIVAALTVSTSNPAANEAVSFAVVAVDPDGDPISYAWSVTCDEGVGTIFTDLAAATTLWTADAAGTCTVRLDATANGRSDTVTLEVVVGPAAGGTGGMVVAATFVPRPYLTSAYVYSRLGSFIHMVDRSDPAADGTVPSPLAVSTQYLVAVNWVGDASAAEVTLSDDCGGTSTVAVSGAGYKTFRWNAPAAGGLCRIALALDTGEFQDGFFVAALVQ